jgi:hypothetical protein
MQLKQDRTRKSGFRGSLNAQDYGSTARPEPQRSMANLVNWWKMRPLIDVDYLPPAARMALTALSEAMEKLS